MNILWDFSFSEKGGALASLEDFVEYLQSNRNSTCNNHLLIVRISRDWSFLPKNVELINITKRNTFEKIKYLALTLPKIIKDKRIEVVVFAGGLPSPFLKIPYVFSVRQALHFSDEKSLLLPSERMRLFLEKQVLKSASRKASAVFVQSHFMKEAVTKAFGKRVKAEQIVWNVLNSGQYRMLQATTQYPKRDKKRLLYVSLASGRPYKNHVILLNSFKLILEAGIKAELVLTCPKQSRSFDREIRAIHESIIVKNLQKDVILTGSISRNETLKLYRESDLFVFPSTCESFGVPLLEAMASGMPIVASDIPVIREITKNCGLYFDPKDTNMIAHTIVVGLENYSELSERSKRTYTENYLGKNIWEQILANIERNS